MVDTRTYNPIPQEYWEQMDDAYMQPLRTKTIGRLIANARGPFGEGKSYVTVRTYTDVPRGVISMRLDLNNRQMISPSETHVPLPYVHSEWTISRRELESLKNGGEPFNTALISSHGYAVGLQEDYLLIDGWKADGTNYKISGFYQAAGNSSSTSRDYATNNNAVLSLGDATALFVEDNIFPPFNLILNATQWGQLASSFYTSAGMFELDVLRKAMKGEVFTSPAMTAATALFLTQPGAGDFDIAVGVEAKQETDLIPLGAMTGEAGGVVGTIFECVAPEVYHSVALCKHTGV